MKNFWPAAWYIGAPLLLAALSGLALTVVFELATVFPRPPAKPVAHAHGPVKMRLFANRAKINRPFALYLFIQGGEAGDRVILHVPPGMELMDGETEVRTVPPAGPAGYAQVVWRLTLRQEGRFLLEVHGPADSVAQENVTFPFGGLHAWDQ